MLKLQKMSNIVAVVIKGLLYHSSCFVVGTDSNPTIIEHHKVTARQIQIPHVIFVYNKDLFTARHVDMLIKFKLPFSIWRVRFFYDTNTAHEHTLIMFPFALLSPAVMRHLSEQFQAFLFVASEPCTKRRAIVLADVVLKDFNFKPFFLHIGPILIPKYMRLFAWECLHVFMIANSGRHKGFELQQQIRILEQNKKTSKFESLLICNNSLAGQVMRVTNL
jgi:hypothetical protein